LGLARFIELILFLYLVMSTLTIQSAAAIWESPRKSEDIPAKVIEKNREFYELERKLAQI
jgi:hypothetical protein